MSCSQKKSGLQLLAGLILTVCPAVVLLSGCSDAPESASTSIEASAVPTSTESVVSTDSQDTTVDSGDDGPAEDRPFEFKPLSTGSSSSAANGSGTHSAEELSRDQQIQSVISKLKPLQVMLGQWHGTTRKEYDGFKALDKHEWLWDLKTDPSRPALVVKSDKSPYIRAGRITWDNSADCFLLSTTDADGIVRDYTGNYTDPVREIVGPDDKLHRVFRLEFTQTAASSAAASEEDWQVAFAQQENNRYLLELARRRGTAPFRRYDTVSTQREGTSFAISDSDYGEKTCIISQGLGTISVSYKGRSYWVCCTGCKAAFEEDPEAWIARAEKQSADAK